MKKDLPLKDALCWIFYSVSIVCALASGALIVYYKMCARRAIDPLYNIEIIVQTGPKKEALPTAYLAELMDLAGDEKSNLYAFDAKLAQKKLCASPLICEAHVKKIYPNTVFVDYLARVPVALLYDYPNVAIDSEAVCFPLAPFYTPKRLCEIYCGLLPFEQEDEYGREGGRWHTSLQGLGPKLALEILNKLGQHSEIKLLRIDVANALSGSAGRKEVVLVIEDAHLPRILRCTPSGYLEQWQRYLCMRSTLPDHPIIVDLRIEDLAYVH